MTFPNFGNKHGYEAFFTPQDFLAYKRQHDQLLDFAAPSGIIFCYQTLLLDQILESEEVVVVPFSLGKLYLLNSTEGKIGVIARFGIGAPVATALLEELIALGTRQFMSIGSAGGLQKGAGIGDIIVCDKAIRDEGVSHHYLPSAKYAYPSPVLTARLKQTLAEQVLACSEGTSWTIDALYRETVAEARHYQEEGVATVEMEAAALFAVAQYRQVDLASAFVVSDSLGELVWNPQFKAPALKKGLFGLYQAAKAALF